MEYDQTHCVILECFFLPDIDKTINQIEDFIIRTLTQSDVTRVI